MSRRMNALSSTTSTDSGVSLLTLRAPANAALEDTIALLQRADFDLPVVEEEVHASAMVAPDVLGEDRNTVGLQREPRIPLRRHHE